MKPRICELDRRSSRGALRLVVCLQQRRLFTRHPPSVAGGNSRQAHTSAWARPLAASLQARRGGASSLPRATQVRHSGWREARRRVKAGLAQARLAARSEAEARIPISQLFPPRNREGQAHSAAASPSDPDVAAARERIAAGRRTATAASTGSKSRAAGTFVSNAAATSQPVRSGRPWATTEVGIKTEAADARYRFSIVPVRTL
jgi:hypothetical protein